MEPNPQSVVLFEMATLHQQPNTSVCLLRPGRGLISVPEAERFLTDQLRQVKYSRDVGCSAMPILPSSVVIKTHPHIHAEGKRKKNSPRDMSAQSNATCHCLY